MEEIRREWKEDGVVTPRFRGAAACLADPIKKTPSTPRRPFQLNPRRMGRARDWTRSTTATHTPGRELFWQQHGEAMRQWVDGHHDVVFPEGTWWLHRFHGARRWGRNGQVQEGTPCQRRRSLEHYQRRRREQRAAADAAAEGARERRRSTGGGGSRRRGPSAEA